REVSFMKGLFRIVDMKRWYLCPQVRVADIVQLNGNIRPRSRKTPSEPARFWWRCPCGITIRRRQSCLP
ncbi:hypothetical protein E2K60_26310, partial [Escherichia coli]